jgi:hypothetical protein
MRTTSDWFAGARRYTDFHHARAPSYIAEAGSQTTFHAQRLGVRSVDQIDCVGTTASPAGRVEDSRDCLTLILPDIVLLILT